VVRTAAEALGVVWLSSQAESALGGPSAAEGSDVASWITGGGGIGIWAAGCRLAGAASPFACLESSFLGGPSLVMVSAVEGRSCAGFGSVPGLSSGGAPIGGRGGPPKMAGNQAGLRMQNRTKDAMIREKPSNAMSGAIGGCCLLISYVVGACAGSWHQGPSVLQWIGGAAKPLDNGDD
jgi:hypothetical protein